MYDLDIGQVCYKCPAKLPLEPKSGTKKELRRSGEAGSAQFKFAYLKKSIKKWSIHVTLACSFQQVGSQLHNTVFLGSCTVFDYSITGRSFKRESKIDVCPGLPTDD